MALKVTWTPRAEQGYDKIIKHLEKTGQAGKYPIL